MSLYNLVRPVSFDEVLGNPAVVNSLKSIVAKKPDKRPHTFLFQGPSGCGKTTIARILSKEFGCASIDFMELDAAKDRGVDSMRRLVDEAQFSPMGGECRIFLLDEVHELTKTAQETLLKTTEDTPPSSYFILCTTDPEKIIQTIRNRCSTFQLVLLRDPEMELLLNNTLEKLKKELSDEIFFGIIDAAEGSPRKALVILEQVLSLVNEKEQLSIIQQAAIKQDVFDLCRHLIRGGEWKDILKTYQKVPPSEPETLRRAILGYVKNSLTRGGSVCDKAFILGSAFRRPYFDSGEAAFLLDLYEVCQKMKK